MIALGETKLLPMTLIAECATPFQNSLVMAMVSMLTT